MSSLKLSVRSHNHHNKKERTHDPLAEPAQTVPVNENARPCFSAMWGWPQSLQDAWRAAVDARLASLVAITPRSTIRRRRLRPSPRNRRRS